MPNFRFKIILKNPMDRLVAVASRIVYVKKSICIAFQGMNMLSRTARGGGGEGVDVAFKIDIKKAFDT